MADLIAAQKPQSLAELRIWPFDFNPDLLTSVTVVSATAKHIPPSGDASTPQVGTITNNIVPVRLGPLAVTGVHILAVLAVCSDGETSELRVAITVDF